MPCESDPRRLKPVESELRQKVAIEDLITNKNIAGSRVLVRNGLVELQLNSF